MLQVHGAGSWREAHMHAVSCSSQSECDLPSQACTAGAGLCTPDHLMQCTTFPLSPTCRLVSALSTQTTRG